MELLFVALGGAIIGLVARYTVRGRESHGVALVPAIGTAVACVAWVALTWLGMKWDGGWIWGISFALSAAASYAAAVVLARRRSESDQRMLHTLIRGGAPIHS